MFNIQCKLCGKKLNIFSYLFGFRHCKECRKQLAKELAELLQTILKSKTISNEQAENLKKHNKKALIKLYKTIYKKYEEDNELDKNELDTLKTIQEFAGLTKEEIDYDENVMPYVYVYSIKNEHKLPDFKLQLVGSSPIIYKKDEKLHFAANAILKELRMVRVGYEGGSQGVSFNIAKGVRYHIGGHRGHIIKEERYIPTSEGALLLTNQRLFLQPAPGNKQANIPLDKITAYQAYKNGLEVFKEGREKGYFFHIDKPGAVEILGICLSFLLSIK